MRRKEKFISAALFLSLTIVTIAFYSNQESAKVQLEEQLEPNAEDPNGARAFHMMKRADPATGNIPAGKAWKALQSASEQTEMQIGKAKNSSTYWNNVDDHFDVLAITRIAYDPTDYDIWYFCTGEGWYNGDASRGAGVWKSIDAGNTWSQLPATDTSMFYRCLDMGVHPFTGDIYVGTRGESYNSSEGGLYRSQDGGQSWTRILGKGLGALQNVACDIEFTTSGGVFVGVGMRSATDGIYYSATGDSGTYTRQTNGFPTTDIERIEIAAYPGADSVAYAVAIHDDDSVAGFWHTTDTGSNWTQVSFPGGNRKFSNRQGWYDLCIAVDPSNPNTLVAGGLHLWKSTDAGQNWTQITTGKRDSNRYVHVDQHEIRYVSSDTIYFGNDGGIYASYNFTDSLPTLEDKNTDYNVTQYYAAAIDPRANNDIVIGGTQDNGSSMSTGGGISDFHRLSGADGAFCYINYQDPDIMYTSTQYKRIYRKKGGGYSDHKQIGNKHLENSEVLFINPFEMDPVDPELLFMASTKGIWRVDSASTAADSSWELACKASTGTITALALSHDSSHTLYYGRTSNFGTIYRIDSAHLSDENTDFIDIDPQDKLPTNFQVGAANIYCSSIFVDPDDAGHIIVTYSNYNTASVYEGKFCNTDSVTWSNIEGNLPDVPVNWAMLHPNNPKVCYLATDIGIYYTEWLSGSSTDWTFDQNGLPNLRVEMIRYRKSDLTVVAATHGRGIYTAKLDPDALNLKLNWQERGPKNVAGRTRSIVIDPNDPTQSTMWAASVSGGLWKTDNIFNVPKATSVSPEMKSQVQSEIKLFPNPTSNGFQLASSFEMKRILIYNLSGKMIHSEQINSSSYKWERDGESAGLYFIRIEGAQHNEIEKLILN